MLFVLATLQLISDLQQAVSPAGAIEPVLGLLLAVLGWLPGLVAVWLLWHPASSAPGAAGRVRERVRLTIALLEAVNDSTARHGTTITEDDPRYWVPLPPVFSMIIGRGQASGHFLNYPPASDAGPFFSNLLLLRVLTRPEESATATTRLILTVLMRTFGVTELSGGIDW